MPRLRTLVSGAHHYQFEIRHLTVFFVTLIVFQTAAILVNQRAADRVVRRTQQWYQQDTAERLANLTTMSFELLLESRTLQRSLSDPEVRQTIQDFNIIFSQQLLDKTVLTVCILLPASNGVISLDDGHDLYDYLFGQRSDRSHEPSGEHLEAERMYREVADQLRRTEQTITVVEDERDFHVFVPFVPRGEFHGALYIKSRPDLSFLTSQLSSTFAETTLIYSGLIVIGLIGAYVISSKTLRQRNDAQHQLFEEHKRNLVEQIHHEKEMMFTKRIYHTHHKAEKFAGFIKDDLRNMNPETMELMRLRVDKYASFVGRVIYDMKWYDPPVQTFRGQLFRTDLNGVVRFLIDHVFHRGGGTGTSFTFETNLDPAFPPIAVNEYVVWEVLEPIIQNAIDHGGKEHLVIRIETVAVPGEAFGFLRIQDSGVGVSDTLLERNATGVQKLFLEYMTSGEGKGKHHAGYGCYIAHQISTERLGWDLTASNLQQGGALFEIRIPFERS